MKDKSLYKFLLSFVLIFITTFSINPSPADSVGNAFFSLVLLGLWSFPFGLIGILAAYLLSPYLKFPVQGLNLLFFAVMFICGAYQFIYIDKKFPLLGKLREGMFIACFIICSILILGRLFFLAKYLFW